MQQEPKKIANILYELKNDKKIPEGLYQQYISQVGSTIDQSCHQPNFFKIPKKRMKDILNEGPMNVSTAKFIAQGLYHQHNLKVYKLLPLFRICDGNAEEFAAFLQVFNRSSFFQGLSKALTNERGAPAEPKELKEYNKKITFYEKKCTEAKEEFINKKFPPVKEKPSFFEDDIDDAVKKDKLSSVQYLIEQEHEDIFTGDIRKEMPLVHVAIKHDSNEVLKYLIEACGASPTQINKDGKKPMDFAVEYGNMDALKYLHRECGIFPSIKNRKESKGKAHKYIEKVYNEYYKIPDKEEVCMNYIEVARTNDIKSLAYILNDKSLREEFQKPYGGFYPLYVAIQAGNIDVVRLCCYAFDVPQEALSVAMQFDQLNIIKFLLEDCPDFKHEDDYKLLVSAVKKGNLEMVKYFIEDQKFKQFGNDGTNESFISYVAVKEGRLNIIKYLFEEAHVELCPQFSNGENLLHAASDTNVAQYLITTWNFNPHVGDKDGLTPLDKACNVQMFKFYSQCYGVVPKLGPQDFLVRAVELNSIELLQFALDELNANPNTGFPNGGSLLHAAVRYNEYSIITYVMDNYVVNVNKQDDNGNTALHYIPPQYKQIAKLLVNNYDIDIDITNKEGKKAIETTDGECKAYLEKVYKKRAEAPAVLPEEE